MRQNVTNELNCSGAECFGVIIREKKKMWMFYENYTTKCTQRYRAHADSLVDSENVKNLTSFFFALNLIKLKRLYSLLKQVNVILSESLLNMLNHLKSLSSCV